jgi:hypothetical protein
MIELRNADRPRFDAGRRRVAACDAPTEGGAMASLRVEKPGSRLVPLLNDMLGPDLLDHRRLGTTTQDRNGGLQQVGGSI